MKYIKIFLAMSEEDMGAELNELSDYIRSLNDLYIGRNIFFELCMPGETDADDIDGSQYFLLLFYRDAEEKIVEDFDIALKKFNVSKTPKIVTYFKIAEEDSISEGVKSFMERLEKGLGHFYNKFDNIDTVKLSMLLEMARNQETKLDIEFQDGKVLADKKEVGDISLDNIPQYFNNEMLNKLREERMKLEEEYIRLQDISIRKKDDKKLYEKLNDIKIKKIKVDKRFHEIEMDVLNMTSKIVGMTTEGKPLTVKAKIAVEYSNVGEYKKGIDVLDDEEWERESDKEKEKIEIGKYNLEGLVNEKRIKIYMLKAQGLNDISEHRILKYYEQAVELIFEYDLDLDFAMEYVDFLWEQKSFKKGTEICEKIYHILQKSDVNNGYMYSRVLNYLGMFYHSTNQYVKAEEKYQEVLKIMRELSKTNRSAYIGKVADICFNLGSLYKDIGKYKEGEKKLQEALEIRRELSKTNRSAYIGYVAKSCNNLGILYKATERYEEAEEKYEEALEIYRELSETNRSAYIGDVANSCNSLGILYKATGRYKEAEEMHQEALKIRRELSKTNRSAYIEKVADSCNALGVLYQDIGKYKAAEEKLQESLDIYIELSETNRSAYIGDVAKSCNNLGILYKATERYEEAEEKYEEALGIYRELSETSRSAYIGDVAMSCNNLGALYQDTRRYKEAEEMHQEALKIRRELSKTNRSAYIGNVANSCNNLAALYLAVGRYDEAKGKCKEALKIYEELNEKGGAYAEKIKELSGVIAWLNKKIEEKGFDDVGHKPPIVEVKDVSAQSKQLPFILTYNGSGEMTKYVLDIVSDKPQLFVLDKDGCQIEGEIEQAIPSVVIDAFIKKIEESDYENGQKSALKEYMNSFMELLCF